MVGCPPSARVGRGARVGLTGRGLTAATVAHFTAQLQLARKRDRFRSQIGQPCPGSVDAFEEFTRRNPKPASDTHEGREADVPLAALQPADLGRMQVARGGQVFLRQLAFLAACSDVLAELLLGCGIGLTATACRSRLHARTLDRPSRKLQSKVLQE
jgi:hypothetical protein